ncbi:MAG: sigma 54-interacting transcriptional regulator [Phycisphaerales bacterium]|nr:sigma 54-interacting transcriptional regulator [Phycisphaerales bacterium]
MPKIILIAPDKRVYLQGKQLVSELDNEREIDIYLAREGHAVSFARKFENSDVAVIISRGRTARQIVQANVRIPVVEIQITAGDLVFMMREAKRLTRKERPRVLIAAAANWLRDAQTIAEIMEIDLTIFQRESEADTNSLVLMINSGNFDIVVSGKKTLVLAARPGFKTLPLSTGMLALRSAFLEAQRVALARKIEKEHAQRFTALVQFSSEGIISVDQNKEIQVLNPAAERFLNCSAEELLGQKIDDCLPFVNIEHCLSKGQELIGQTVHWGKVWLSFNIAPIDVDGTISGAIITFQNITRIQETEARFRNEVLAKQFVARYTFEDIAGISQRIEEARRIGVEIAAVDASVLISGESGTGKELFAQSVHNTSKRRKGPFVAVNCAALPPNLLESELFGYVEGAFTGATKKGKPGLFEMAHRGTIFLDEISEMDRYGQNRLLRVLQERQVMRLGDDKNIPIDVRIIAATNRNLAMLIDEGNFRQDLYYRLKVLTLKLPPLRSRTGDIQFLAESFVRKYNQIYSKHIKITRDALDTLARYPWPGNIRELMFFIERLVVIASEKIISPEMITRYWEESDDKLLAHTSMTPNHTKPSAASSEKEIISETIINCRYNKKRAAAILGIDRSTLYRKLKQYGITDA